MKSTFEIPLWNIVLPHINHRILNVEHLTSEHQQENIKGISRVPSGKYQLHDPVEYMPVPTVCCDGMGGLHFIAPSDGQCS